VRGSRAIGDGDVGDAGGVSARRSSTERMIRIIRHIEAFLLRIGSTA